VSAAAPAELLIQMDGLMGKKPKGSSGTTAEEPQVFVLAATNMPWELDMVRVQCSGLQRAEWLRTPR
jgi:SpoVK/Ycf46/Vps4 family AAA+-type ATPase